MMLLANLTVENHKDAKRVLRLYVRRWECEEEIRFLKSHVNLEKNTNVSLVSNLSISFVGGDSDDIFRLAC